MNEANWEQEFDEQFLHGMKIVISEPYQEMALESTVANEIKQFISKTLSLHDKKLAEKLDRVISDSAAEFFIKINGGGNGRRIMIQYEHHLRKLAAQVIEGKE